ncbi:MAG: zinc ribbon domain-containing protein [Thermodesulfobacteriota bacterium]
MKEKIKVLIELQNCDNRIRSLEKRKTEAPLRIKALSNEMELVAKGFEEDDERLRAVKSERRSLESEVDELDDKIRKGNEKLSNIKSNKEYTAALKEIESLNKKKALLEDRIIRHIEEMELVADRCRQNKEQLEALKERFEQERKETQEELLGLEKELAKLNKKRSGISAKADPQFLRQYQLVRERLGSHAVSPVIGGVCRTCNMGIPPQMFNELMKCEELTSCPHCNRIVYWGEDAFFQDLTNS